MDISAVQSVTISAVQNIIGYHFNDSLLLVRALTHPSIQRSANNEQLEFLGDRVLGLIVATRAYQTSPDAPEGMLVEYERNLVNNIHLARCVVRLGLHHALKVASSVKGATRAQFGLNQLEKACADMMEAIIGAIYLDGGIGDATEFVTRHIMSVGRF